MLFPSALAGYWTIFCSNSIPMAVNGGVKKCSHACGGRIHSLQSSDFCSDWDTSSQPTHCRNIHLSYLQIFSRAFFSRISCQTLLFPLSLKPSRCPYRELSGRLVDAKLPLSSGRNRWLLKHFSYLLIVSDTTRVRLDCVCTVTLTIINTFWNVFQLIFFLSPCCSCGATETLDNKSWLFVHIKTPILACQQDLHFPLQTDCSCGHCNRSGFIGAPLRGTAAPDEHHAGRHKNRRPSPSFWTGHAWSHARWVSPYCWEISSVFHKWTSHESKQFLSVCHYYLRSFPGDASPNNHILAKITHGKAGFLQASLLRK